MADNGLSWVQFDPYVSGGKKEEEGAGERSRGRAETGPGSTKKRN